MKTLEKVILFALVIVVVTLVLVPLKPWTYGNQYIFEYLRGRAVEIAEAIEQKHPTRLIES